MLPTCPRQLLLALTLHPCRFGINVAMYSIPAVITTVVIACHPLTGPASSGAAGAWGRAWRRCVRRRRRPDPAICAACSGFSTEPRNFAPRHSFASRWLCAAAEKKKCLVHVSTPARLLSRRFPPRLWNVYRNFPFIRHESFRKEAAMSQSLRCSPRLSNGVSVQNENWECRNGHSHH